ncbi:MAG: mechanosensitive ion channel family protein [Verrucomicrobiia bacterium]|jgi:small conductance mechanosensitive channel
MQLEQWQTTVVTFFITYGFQIVGAFIILIVGALVARWVGRLSDGWLVKHALEPPVRVLMVRVVRLIVFGFAVVLALDKFGVPITPLVAGIGVAGVGIGLAAQGVLGNIFAGLTIIFTKPFRVGEYIELLNVNGQVTDIELFATTLLHSDRSRVVIPNRKIVGEILHNYGATRQLDLRVSIAYSADLNRALATVHEILRANPRVLKDPEPVVGIESLGDSSITLGISPWVSVPDYVVAQLEIYQAIIEQFRVRGIEIPFPQHEVRLLGQVSA